MKIREANKVDRKSGGEAPSKLYLLVLASKQFEKVAIAPGLFP
jgi:hypothetical protein